MSVVTVRRAAPDDVAAIARIYREASPCNEGDRSAPGQCALINGTMGVAASIGRSVAMVRGG